MFIVLKICETRSKHLRTKCVSERQSTSKSSNVENREADSARSAAAEIPCWSLAKRDLGLDPVSPPLPKVIRVNRENAQVGVNWKSTGIYTRQRVQAAVGEISSLGHEEVSSNPI